jgi:hypothetical protein
MGNKPICLPFASAAQYCEYVNDPARYRQYLSEMLRRHPKLFPKLWTRASPFTTAPCQANKT